MLLLFLLSSGILFTEANIAVKNNTNILEGCLNELLDFINEEKKFVHVVNTNIRILNYPSVFFNRISEIRKIPTIVPDIYLLSGNVSEVLSVLYKLKILSNSKYFIVIVQNKDESIVKSLEQYFISKLLFITLNSKKGYYEIYRTASTGPEIVHICPRRKEIGPAINQLRKKIIKKYYFLNVLYTIDEPFVISTTQGIHIELLNIVAENINVKLNFIKTKERTIVLEVTPEFISNWTYDLYAALFCSRLSTQSHSFDETTSTTGDKLVFLTPNILITDNWTIFHGEFTNSVWAYFIILLLILSVIISLVDYLVPEEKHTNILSFLLSVLFEGTFTLNSKQRSVKIIFINYLIFVLIFTTVYKSRMFDIIRKDNAYNPIKRQIDMLKYKFKICLPTQTLFDSYKTSKDPVEYYFYWNSVVIVNPNYWQCVNMTAYEKNTVTLILSKRLEYVGQEVYLDENGFPLLNILLKDFHSYLYFVFAFRKGHPLFKIFNKKLTILKETGFVQYQYKFYKRQFEKAVAVAQKKSSFYFKPLKLNSLQSVFVVYIALISVSSLVFGLELVLGKARTINQ
ncbi:Ionotropic receptor 138 [Diabrotica virgifera virgifera]|nr:Ionotropic receptor 138 [Diabrotica virgifera virgifera]